MDITPDLLREELEIYEQGKSAWLGEGRGGRWVLIMGQEVVGFFATSREAYLIGIERGKSRPFFTREIGERDRVAVVSRVPMRDM